MSDDVLPLRPAAQDRAQRVLPPYPPLPEQARRAVVEAEERDAFERAEKEREGRLRRVKMLGEVLADRFDVDVKSARVDPERLTLEVDGLEFTVLHRGGFYGDVKSWTLYLVRRCGDCGDPLLSAVEGGLADLGRVLAVPPSHHAEGDPCPAEERAEEERRAAPPAPEYTFTGETLGQVLVKVVRAIAGEEIATSRFDGYEIVERRDA